jgi:hypothetical protein
MVQEELDRQAGELRRIARGLGVASGPDSRAELQVSRILHLSDEQLYEDWPKDMPSGWLDDSIKAPTRVRAHERGLLFLGEAFDQALSVNLKGDIDQLLPKARGYADGNGRALLRSSSSPSPGGDGTGSHRSCL